VNPLYKFVRIFLVPGAVFQSIVVGDGYGTGREVVQYFTRFGPAGGAFAILVAFAIFAIVLALTFELCRRFNAYDYRAFFKVLLGRYWFSYELVSVFMLLLTFAVLIAAGVGVLSESFGVPPWLATSFIFAAIAVLEFYGRDLVLRVLTFWSLVLYAVFFCFIGKMLVVAQDGIVSVFASGGVEPGWAISGFQYGLYNITVVPFILYAARAFETRSQALISGCAAAAIAIVPAAILHVAFSGAGLDLSDAEIPVFLIMKSYSMQLLTIAFSVMLLGTLIETGAGLMQGINDRIDSQLIDYSRAPLGKVGHTLVALVFLSLAYVISSFGIVDLIAKGYGSMAWALFAIYFIPLVTVGVLKLRV
jgi:uncharacterized membrane protein YkvI